MLKFQVPPDRIFMTILEYALTLTIDEIRTVISTAKETEEVNQMFENLLPLAVRVFSAETALNTLKRMHACHKRPGLYSMNDYHFFLLYDTLQHFCEIHNDMVKLADTDREKDKASKLGGYRIERIEFDDIIGIYFFDTDFLIDSNAILDLGLDRRKALGINDEAFGISQGLAPHPEELKIKVLKNEKAVLTVRSDYFGASSRVYPDLELEEREVNG